MKALTPFALIILVLASVLWLDDTPPDADLVFVNQNEVFTLDPQRMSYLQDLRLSHLLYEGLLRWDNYTFDTLNAAAVKEQRGSGVNAKPCAKFDIGLNLRFGVARRAVLLETSFIKALLRGDLSERIFFAAEIHFEHGVVKFPKAVLLLSRHCRPSRGAGLRGRWRLAQRFPGRRKKREGKRE